MIKFENQDILMCFADIEQLGEWLIEQEKVRSFRDFVNEEYSAWEILAHEYTFGEIYTHYWEAEVLETIRDLRDDEIVEEI